MAKKNRLATRVRATRDGFYDGHRPLGAEFYLAKAEDFAAAWMEKVVTASELLADAQSAGVTAKEARAEAADLAMKVTELKAAGQNSADAEAKAAEAAVKADALETAAKEKAAIAQAAVQG